MLVWMPLIQLHLFGLRLPFVACLSAPCTLLSHHHSLYSTSPFSHFFFTYTYRSVVNKLSRSLQNLHSVMRILGPVATAVPLTQPTHSNLSFIATMQMRANSHRLSQPSIAEPKGTLTLATPARLKLR